MRIMSYCQPPCNPVHLTPLSSSPMPLEVIQYPHPTLRHPSRPLKKIDAQVRAWVAEMFELMYKHKGIGLAANQVDLPYRFFIVNETGDKRTGKELVFVNPVLTRPKGQAEAEEGCLSLPGVYADVRRPAQITVDAFDLERPTDALRAGWIIFARRAARDGSPGRADVHRSLEQHEPIEDRVGARRVSDSIRPATCAARHRRRCDTRRKDQGTRSGANVSCWSRCLLFTKTFQNFCH